MDKFRALVVRENNDSFERNIEEKSFDDLPAGELLIRVHYSSLNYKDALSASGNKGVTRNYPHTPGIDASGVVESSSVKEFSQGDEVIVTSYDLGMNTAGGFADYIQVPANWVVKLPEELSLREAMALGTAGLTAGMSVAHIVNSISSSESLVAVSGATGGVGSLSVAILARLGYEVAAITGKESESAYLRGLGAQQIIRRQEFQEVSKRPLLKTAFAAAIDTVGGTILENLIKSVDHMGVVTVCGNVAAADFQTNVYPFILRGLTVVGIESQNFPMKQRREIWQKLASVWKLADFSLVKEISLNELNQEIEAMLAGNSKGRVLINMRD